MDGFTTEALKRLPLAEATLRLFQYAFDSETLDEIFQAHRGRSFERTLSFETIVHLVGDALLEHGGSGRQSFQRAEEAKQLSTTIVAVYGKLRRLPISLSNGLLLAGSQRLQQLLPTIDSELPKSLQKFICLFVDGKKLKHLSKLMKAARKVKAAILGGKTAAALDWRTGLVLAISAHPDGEVSDAPLMPDLLSQVFTHIPGLRLFILDRQFCDLVQPQQLTAQGDHFLIRHNAKMKFHRDKSKKQVVGKDKRGLKYTVEWGWIGSPKDPRRREVRRIYLKRPGEYEDVILLTDLLDEDEYPAVDLLDAYLARWGIERVFQRITEVFHLRNLITTSPEGTIFQFSFCMLLYNLIQVVRHILAAEQELPVEDISTEQLFYDVHRQLVAWKELTTPEATLEELQPAYTTARLKKHLVRILAPTWTDRWLKTPSKKKTTEEPEPLHVQGRHTSIYRLVQRSRPPAK
jgi:hypothetical protein